MTSNKYVTDYVPRDPFPYDIHGSPFESAFSPSGLVPYPCAHGLSELPPGHPQVHRVPRRSSAGGELPPWGSQSWGRSKHLRIVFYGGRTEHLPGGQAAYVPIATIKCPVCLGEPRPSDLTEPRE